METEIKRFGELRGVRWRIGLGILPSFSTIDDLRKVTADSRRRYASLRRRLLVDPHLPKDGHDSPDRVMDNPLSQNPDSMWGRFFRNAELEKMVDQDLSRLYPEHGSYFQTMGCQSTLRRILLLWCLKHPECGYRQGMHELLAPLLYVLHADVEHLSQVRKLHEDHFVDKFDDLPFEENDLSYNFDFKRFSESRNDEIDLEGCPSKSSSASELDPEVQDIVLLSDAYGAEGELGVVLSDKFLEHDAYCMFDALMSGNGGAVSMADFFSPSPVKNSHTGLPPVIEASSALYHLLSIVDSSIYSHLIELGVEPQYFALRWLRVLFGREFCLEDLVIIWDEIFSCDNGKVDTCADDSGSSFAVLSSLRGAFISAFAVAMVLRLRSSLLATENATSCLQRLLNFPANADLKKLLAKTKSLQALALDANNSTPLPLHNGIYEKPKPIVTRGHSRSVESISPITPLSLVPESYWEEKWRDLYKEEKLKQSSIEKEVTNRKKGWSEKVRFCLSRTESAPSSSKTDSSKKDPKLSVRRSLLDDLSKQLGLEEDRKKTEHIEDPAQTCSTIEEIEEQIEEHTNTNKNTLFSNENRSVSFSDEDREKTEHIEVVQKDSTHGELEKHSDPNKNLSFLNEDKNLSYSDEENCSSGSVQSEENSSSFSDSPGHNHVDSPSDRSSFGSSSSVIVNKSPKSESSTRPMEDLSPPISDPPEGKRKEVDPSKENDQKPGSGLQGKKVLSGRFQWFWRFGRNNGGEGSLGKGGPVPSDPVRGVDENTKALNGESEQNNNNDKPAALVLNGTSDSSVSEGESADQNMKPQNNNNDKPAALVLNGINDLSVSKGESADQNMKPQNNNNDKPPALVLNGISDSSVSKGESADQNVMVSLRNLGQSMIDNIQVIESVFQQQECGQVKPMSALKELRKISNILSEM